MWAKTSTLSGSYCAFSYGTNSTSKAMFIGQSGSALLVGGYNNDISVPNFWTQDEWHHVCLTYDGTTAKVYGDGIELASESKAWNLVLLRAFIARNVNGQIYWQGLTDDVRVYDYALTATEVRAIMGASFINAPSALSATAVSSSQINLSWTDNSDNETGFQIERATSENGTYSLIHTTTANVTTYQNTELSPGTQYYYRVRASNGVGNSRYSNVADATTIAIPAVPSNFVATATSSSSITLTWTDNSDNESGFELQFSLHANSGFNRLRLTGPNVTSFVSNHLSADARYYFRLWAANGSGTPSSYVTASARTLPLVTVTAPECVSAKRISSTSVEISWTDTNSDEDGYEIERSTGESFELIHTTSPNATTFTDNSVAAATSYTYQVRAVKGNAKSDLTASNVVGTGSLEQDILNQYAFQYKYDERNRMVEKKAPGADWVYMVYDNRDRLVLTQDGNQRSIKASDCTRQREWTFTKYDALNRPVMTGIYVHNGTRESLQTAVNDFYAAAENNPDEWFEVRGSTVHGYTNQSFPKVTDESQYLTVTYYDDDTYQTLLPGGSTNFLYSACEIPDAEAPQLYKQYSYSGTTCQNKISFPRLKGMVTATKTRVLGEGATQWLWSVNHYDDKGRVVQNISTNSLYQLDRTTMIYDFVGKVLYTKTLHNVGQSNTKTIARKFDYDHAGRLLKTWHRIGGSGSFILLSENEYNELGQLVTKKLHSENNGSSFEQEVDHRYNIRGWLTSINDPSSSDPNDLFSMRLRYTDPTISGIPAQYNGNISQIDWKGGDEENQQYGYKYDPMNRLLDAQYFNQSDPLKNRRYDEKIWNNNSNSAYDLNGNIQGIIRKGETGTDGSGMTTYGEMDEIRYSYRGNQLLKVDDLKNKNYGFKDGNNTDDDYRYDANGNMIIDKNKEIESVSTATGNSVITYNYLNLPEIVRKNTGEYVKYIYDATGRKLRQEVYNESNQRIKQSIYAGEFFYEGENAGGNAQAQLKFINTEEGRVIMTGSTPEYQYHLKDHLGNVRVTFTTVEQVENFVATVEDANADQEEGEFLNYADATKIRSMLFDNTHRDDQNQMMRAASVTDDQGKGTKAEIATRLSGIGRERYGLAKSLRVMPGDVIRMEVFAKYTDPSKKNWVAGFEGALSEATVTAPATVVDGAMRNAAAASSALPVGALLAKPAGGVAPKAYLNYVMYDNNFVPITDAYQTNFVQVTEAARENGINGTPERLYAEVQVKQAGYIYVYLSNDNYEMRGEPVDVFFDDFGIQQVHSNVVQMDDYYPFGLTFNSYKRENSVENKIKFQGQEHIDDLNLGWVSFRWRNHDPTIGRFFNVDPLSDKYVHNSVYAFSENKVTNHIELEGLEAVDRKVLDDPAKAANRGGMKPIQAALQSNVTSNARAANNSASNILSGNVGVQGAGIGVRVKVGGALHVEASGKVLAAEAGYSNKDGSAASVSVAETSFGLKVANVGAEATSTNMTFDGEEFKVIDQSVNVNLGPIQYGTSENEFSVGATLGNLSAEISANLDAVGDAIDSTVEAVKSFFQNLLPPIWEE